MTPERLIEFTGNHPILVATAFIILAVLIYTFVSDFTKKYKSVDPQGMVPLVNREAGVVFDLRGESAYSAGHIVNAHEVGASKLAEKAAKVATDKSKPVICVCNTGQQSGAACKTLIAEGYEQVYNLSGGMMAWEKENMPLEKT